MAAQRLLEKHDQHRHEEATRVRWLCFLSVVVGLVLAYLLQIDALDLPAEAIPNVATLNHTINSWGLLPDDFGLTVGMVLTGVAVRLSQ